jgi:FG-GAP-like repeat
MPEAQGRIMPRHRHAYIGKVLVTMFGLARPACVWLLVGCASIMAECHGAEWTKVVIDSNFPGAYQVEVADINGDRKPDIVALGGATCAWYENPSWKKRIITGPKQSPGVISSATADINGDGKAEVAIAYEFEMNKPKQGKLLLAKQGRGLDDPWTIVPIGEIPSIHRLRWGAVTGKKQLDLIIAPLFGPESAPPRYQQGRATIRRWVIPDAHAIEKSPAFQKLSSHLVLHAIEVIDVNGDGIADILAADNEGTRLISSKADQPAASSEPVWTYRSLIPGSRGEPPKLGSSEIHLGHFRDGGRFLATVEPWHGTDVAIWPEQGTGSLKFGPRMVIDETLADGHALWVADVDRDGDDEVLAGHRGKDHRVSLYDFDRPAKRWNRTVIDREIAAQDLRGGDINGDGTPDVVAVGGSTHNVVWYRFDPR